MDHDMIVGIHSIAEALKNPERQIFEIVATDEGFQELKKRGGLRESEIPLTKVRWLESHALQEEAKRIYRDLDLEFQRVPSGIFMLVSPINIYDPSWIYTQLESRIPIKILALDQVTDAHNGAAIMRTAAFYGVDVVLISAKGNFGLGPGFARIASGATEHVKIARCSALPKTITKIKELGAICIGLSEHASGTLEEVDHKKPICLVLGAEDVGMSHAVSRVVETTIAFKPAGKIKSLNVSVAAAIAMEKIFGNV
ncbi:MAG: RNA methyltransferase [Bacteriovoracaceae bacterium]|nr:RNA methyltransferase [Bacteriovoracaceae bacterium]